MNARGNMIVRGAVHAALISGIVVVCSVVHEYAYAEPDALPGRLRIMSADRLTAVNEMDRRQFRPFQREAIEACSGKREGDPCLIRTPKGMREGLCLSGNQNIFACRPQRSSAQPETTPLPSQPPTVPVPKAAPEQQAEPRPAASPEGLPRGGGEPANGNEAVHAPMSGPAVQPPKSAAAALQPAPSPLPVPPPSTLQPVQPGLYGMLVGNAGHPGSYIAVALLAAGLSWYAFFRYSTIPLRRLRSVTQQLAGGDLSARVGEGLVFRKNEVADLGRDVDRMAERIESLVGAHHRLIRDVSHELRSPLARLNVALELARQSAGPSHSAPFDRIERESDRLNELIGQLLMLTRLENEGGTVQRAELDVAALITEVAQDADFEAKSNDRMVTTTVCQPLLLVGNRELLRQALENLVRNAVRYTAPATAVEISLRKRESHGRSWAHIEVRDRGPGVPESELYDIFRPFYRVSDSRERQSGGTGVGLAISDRAVRLHGGSLRAFNAPGVGLIMEMELPLKQP